MAKTFRAVYKDAQGRTYSCPVQIHDGQWKLVTTSGFAPITHALDNEEYGVVTFHSYREEIDSRLHIEPRIPGQSSFRQLQEARAASIDAERKHRQKARTEIQQVAPDPKTQARERAAKEHAAQVLNARRPNGLGVGLVIGKKE